MESGKTTTKTKNFETGAFWIPATGTEGECNRHCNTLHTAHSVIEVNFRAAQIQIQIRLNTHNDNNLKRVLQSQVKTRGMERHCKWVTTRTQHQQKTTRTTWTHTEHLQTKEAKQQISSPSNDTKTQYITETDLNLILNQGDTHIICNVKQKPGEFLENCSDKT